MWNITSGVGVPDTYDHSLNAYPKPLGPGVAHTFGSWTNIIPSLEYDICALQMSYWPQLNLDSNTLLEVAIGTAGNEVVVWRSHLSYASFDSGMKGSRFIPLQLRRGTRVSARFMFNSTATTVSIYVVMDPVPLSPFAPPGFHGCEIHGVGSTSANNPPISVSRSYTAGPPVSGTITQVVAATANAWRHLQIYFSTPADVTYLERATCRVLAGPANSEQVIAVFHMAGENRAMHHQLYDVPVRVAAGTRIALELIENVGSGNNDTIFVQLFGWY